MGLQRVRHSWATFTFTSRLYVPFHRRNDLSNISRQKNTTFRTPLLWNYFLKYQQWSAFLSHQYDDFWIWNSGWPWIYPPGDTDNKIIFMPSRSLLSSFMRNHYVKWITKPNQTLPVFKIIPNIILLSSPLPYWRHLTGWCNRIHQ